MASENTKDLSHAVKDLINLTYSLVEDSQIENTKNNSESLNLFADKVWKINHYSNEILNQDNVSESTIYNLKMLKSITESPIYSNTGTNESTTLVSAVDSFKNENKREQIDLIFNNLIKDPNASAVLFDNLMIIYKELAA